MQFPLVLIHESKSVLRDLLLVRKPDPAWLLREVRDRQGFFTALPPGRWALLIVELGKDHEKALEWLQEVRRRRPRTALVVVLPRADVALAGLAWDFGAAAVVPPGRVRADLPGLIERLVAHRGALNEAEATHGGPPTAPGR